MKRIIRAVQILGEDRPRLGAILDARNELKNYLESEEMERKVKIFQNMRAEQLERDYSKWMTENHHVKVTDRQVTTNQGELVLMVFYDDSANTGKDAKK